MSIFKIEVPLDTYFSASSVNAYLIKDDPITFIDIGPYDERAIRYIENFLSNLKLRFSDIKRIYITHGHVDHCGLAGFLQDKFSTEIYIHDNDRVKVTLNAHEKMKFREDTIISLINSLQFDASLINVFKNFFKDFFKFGTTVKEVKSVKEGDIINFDHFNLKVLHLPGHTAGSCGYLIEDKKNIFTGDVILEKIFVTPVMEFKESGKPYNNFDNYIKTLDKLDQFINYKILPGHGSFNVNLKKRIYEIKNSIYEKINLVKSKFDPTKNLKDNFYNIFPNSNERNFYFYFSIFYGCLVYLKMEVI